MSLNDAFSRLRPYLDADTQPDPDRGRKVAWLQVERMRNGEPLHRGWVIEVATDAPLSPDSTRVSSITQTETGFWVDFPSGGSEFFPSHRVGGAGGTWRDTQPDPDPAPDDADED